MRTYEDSGELRERMRLSSVPSLKKAQDIRLALRFENRIAEAIQETLPNGAGQRHRRIFDLVRTLKAIPELKKRRGASLRSLVKLWHQQALPVIGTKEFEATLCDFLDGWQRCEVPKGEGKLGRAVKRAETAMTISHRKPRTIRRSASY